MSSIYGINYFVQPASIPAGHGYSPCGENLHCVRLSTAVAIVFFDILDLRQLQEDQLDFDLDEEVALQLQFGDL